MLGFLVLARAVFKMSPVGAAHSTLKHSSRTAEAYRRMANLRLIEEEQRLGLNREEEAFSLRQHGEREQLFPFRLAAENFPGFEKLLGQDLTGEYLWKLSEWNELSHWLQVLYLNSTREKKIGAGRDGRWLLQVGQARWKVKKLKEDAFANAAKFSDMLTNYDFIIREN